MAVGDSIDELGEILARIADTDRFGYLAVQLYESYAPCTKAPVRSTGSGRKSKPRCISRDDDGHPPSRFRFFSHENRETNEPAHIHVESGNGVNGHEDVDSAAGGQEAVRAGASRLAPSSGLSR